MKVCSRLCDAIDKNGTQAKQTSRVRNDEWCGHPLCDSLTGTTALDKDQTHRSDWKQLIMSNPMLPHLVLTETLAIF